MVAEETSLDLRVGGRAVRERRSGSRLRQSTPIHRTVTTTSRTLKILVPFSRRTQIARGCSRLTAPGSTTSESAVGRVGRCCEGHPPSMSLRSSPRNWILAMQGVAPPGGVGIVSPRVQSAALGRLARMDSIVIWVGQRRSVLRTPPSVEVDARRTISDHPRLPLLGAVVATVNRPYPSRAASSRRTQRVCRR